MPGFRYIFKLLLNNYSMPYPKEEEKYKCNECGMCFKYHPAFIDHVAHHKIDYQQRDNRTNED